MNVIACPRHPSVLTSTIKKGHFPEPIREVSFLGIIAMDWSVNQTEVKCLQEGLHPLNPHDPESFPSNLLPVN